MRVGVGVSQIPCFFAPSGRRCPLDRRNTRRRPLRTCRPGTGLLNDIYTYPATNDRLQPIALGAGGTCSFTYDAAGNVTYDNRSGQGYGYTYDNAGRMASFSLNGVVQAEYRYNQLGQQIIRRLTQTGVTIHSVYGPDGNRIAEYNEATGALIRQYIWLEGAPIAVIEGGVISFVRSDHIGRPVFATNSAGVKVWTAAYLPFGGVRVATGTPPTARFPGQWFQSETGLHQNWMRDYDPTTGRYMQADPLGLVDGASVYGYARQSPGRYVDPRGEDSGGMSFPTPVPPVFIPGTQQNQDFGNGVLGGLGILSDLSHRYNPIDLALQWIVEQCTSCPPCRTVTGQVVPVGTPGHRYNPSSRGHYPYNTGDHVHLYEARQNPNNCQCFWHNLSRETDPPPAPNSIDIFRNPLISGTIGQ